MLRLYKGGDVLDMGLFAFVQGPNAEEFQLVADSIATLRNLVAKIAEGLPAQDETESVTSGKNCVCRTCEVLI